MVDICGDKDFDLLNMWICDSGVYVITGNKRVGQLELATSLCLSQNCASYYYKMKKKDTLLHVVDRIVRFHIGKKECALIDNVSTDLLEANEKYLLELDSIAKKNDVRFFMCYNSRIKNIDKILQSTCGVLEIVHRPFGSAMKVKIWTSEHKQFKIKIRKFHPVYKKSSKDFEVYVRKCYENPSIMNPFIDMCYDDIFDSKEACNLMLHINNKRYKQYEMKTKTYLLRPAENIHELWMAILMFGTSLDDYVYELFGHMEKTLLFLYKNGANRVIAVIGIRDGEIRDIIYQHDVLSCSELQKWLKEYAEEKGILISTKCHWKTSEMLLGSKYYIALE